MAIYSLRRFPFPPSFVKSCLLLGVSLLNVSISCAELLEFPQQLCAMELPNSSTWSVQKPDKDSDKTKILVALSDDQKIVGSIVVQDIFPPSPKDQEEFLAGARFGLTKSGWKVTGERTQPFGKLVGHLIASKAVSDGTPAVQTSLYLFANNRTYVITAAIAAEKITPDLVKRATDFHPGFKLIPAPKTP